MNEHDHHMPPAERAALTAGDEASRYTTGERAILAKLAELDRRVGELAAEVDRRMPASDGTAWVHACVAQVATDLAAAQEIRNARAAQSDRPSAISDELGIIVRAELRAQGGNADLVAIAFAEGAADGFIYPNIEADDDARVGRCRQAYDLGRRFARVSEEITDALRKAGRR